MVALLTNAFQNCVLDDEIDCIVRGFVYKDDFFEYP